MLSLSPTTGAGVFAWRKQPQTSRVVIPRQARSVWAPRILQWSPYTTHQVRPSVTDSLGPHTPATCDRRTTRAARYFMTVHRQRFDGQRLHSWPGLIFGRVRPLRSVQDVPAFPDCQASRSERATCREGEASAVNTIAIIVRHVSDMPVVRSSRRSATETPPARHRSDLGTPRVSWSFLRRNASRGATSPTTAISEKSPTVRPSRRLNPVHSTGLALPVGVEPRVYCEA